MTSLPNPDITSYLRVRVIRWDNRYLYVQAVASGVVAFEGETSVEESAEEKPAGEKPAGEETLTVSYTPHWNYLQPLLRPDDPLNLVRPENRDGILYPRQIIYRPDYLVNISSIAACFQKFGTSPYLYLINKVKQTPEGTAILLGNFAGMLLDKELQPQNGATAEESFEQVRQAFCRRYALPLAVCTETERNSLYKQARLQQQMLRQILDNAKKEWAFAPEKALTEPSFFCEMLGLQGRMDLLQEDKKILIEQKSGKRDEYRNLPVEGHYVQMNLYLALLHYAFDLPHKDIRAFLLYSKYPDGLMLEEPNDRLLSEALKIRNQIVWNEYQFCNGGAEKVWERLTAGRLNDGKKGGRLWTDFQKPKYEQLLQTVQQAPALEKAYFYRFFTFIEKELLYAKAGNDTPPDNSFAATWNTDTRQRRLEGNLLDRLTLLPPKDGAVEEITLQITRTQAGDLPNFRLSDPVIAFPYLASETPDIRRDRVMRGAVNALEDGQIRVLLSAPQQNRSLFERPQPQWQWALVHDFMESSFSVQFQALFSFLQMDPKRRDLLLSRRMPETAADPDAVTLKGDYSADGTAPERNQLVWRAQCARELFLIVGPPGTGKTSFALMNILQETLASATNPSILLCAYTHRAVDEICSKLDQSGVDYLRFGNASTCAPAHRSHLVEAVNDAAQDIPALTRRLQQTPVLVGTLSSLSSKPQLFILKHFTLSIIDEASQILEPQLLPLLHAVDRSGKPAIDKFVLIGDQKQLPAIVQQSLAESVVQESELTAIGLTDCRHSLFERLYNTYKDNPHVVFRLHRQGRMHPQIARFPGRAFYGDRLQCVPLPHQQDTDPLWPTDSANSMRWEGDPVGRLIATRRTVFLPVRPSQAQATDKVNRDEAQLIARCLRILWEIYRSCGLPFLPGQSMGVIVPYRHQIAAVTRAIEEDTENPQCRKDLLQIAVDTVERYQGSERDTILYGFTVSRPYQLDFLTNQVYREDGPDGQLIDRKLNVILTRARRQLILVGNPELLNTVPLYRQLLEHIQLMQTGD